MNTKRNNLILNLLRKAALLGVLLSGISSVFGGEGSLGARLHSLALKNSQDVPAVGVGFQEANNSSPSTILQQVLAEAEETAIESLQGAYAATRRNGGEGSAFSSAIRRDLLLASQQFSAAPGGAGQGLPFATDALRDHDTLYASSPSRDDRLLENGASVLDHISPLGGGGDGTFSSQRGSGTIQGSSVASSSSSGALGGQTFASANSASSVRSGSSSPTTGASSGSGSIAGSIAAADTMASTPIQTDGITNPDADNLGALVNQTSFGETSPGNPCEIAVANGEPSPENCPNHANETAPTKEGLIDLTHSGNSLNDLTSTPSLERICQEALRLNRTIPQECSSLSHARPKL